MRESAPPDVFRGLAQVIDLRELIVGDREPSQAPALVGAGPQAGVTGPEAADLAGAGPLVERGLHRARETGPQLPGLAAGHAPAGPQALVDRVEQLHEGVDEDLHALGEQLVGHRVHRDAAPGQGIHRVLGVLEIVLEAGAGRAVVAEGVEVAGGMVSTVSRPISSST